MGNALYKGYIETRGKAAVEKFKNRRDFRTLEEARNLRGYAGVLASDTVMIDIDDAAQSEMLMKIVEARQLNCRVVQTARGRHFLFKNREGKLNRNRVHVNLAIGLNADIKVGANASYEVLKKDGEERFIEWDINEDLGETYDEVPFYLIMTPSCKIDFPSLTEGNGRNNSLYAYILTLMGYGLTVEEIKTTIRLINKYILPEKLDDAELETILRDESFKKPVFYMGSTFLFDKFATYIKGLFHIVRISDQLHIYKDGVYIPGYKEIEARMIELIPALKKNQRREVLDYLELITEDIEPSDARYVAFTNGLYDIVDDRMLEYTPDIVVLNKIPWEYEAQAYNELTDKTLNKLACRDRAIRELLEECIGYCLYRRNELGKAFILTGDKSNGKSTFLDMIKAVLGEHNISALDLKELGDRFSTSMMFGKLANIGDDIGDDFLQGAQVAIFKKVVTGNRIKAERKGQDPFEFNPYVKLLFSANDIPRMRDKTGAVLRRLIIIPFNATFSKDDPDFDPYIKWKLISEESVKYLITLGIKGIKRIIENNSFTDSQKAKAQLEEYEMENNPIKAFIAEVGNGGIVNQSSADVYTRYQVFCAENQMTAMSKIVFSKQICKRMDVKTVVQTIGGKSYRMFVKEG